MTRHVDGADTARESWSTSPPTAPGPTATHARRAGPGHRHRRSPPPSLGTSRRGDRAAAPSGADPGGGRLTVVALVGVTASGKSELALDLARRRGDFEIVSVDSMCVYRGMDIGTSKPEREGASGRSPPPARPRRSRSRSSPSASFQEAAREALAAVNQQRGHHALLVGGTGLYLRAVVDDLSIPGRYPDVRRRAWRPSWTRAGPAGRAARPPGRARPGGGGADGASNRRRVVRALEVTIGAGRPFLAVRPGARGLPRHGGPQVGLVHGPEEIDRRIAERFGRWSRRAWWTRCGRWPPARGDLPHGAPGPGLSRAPGPRGGGCPLADCLEEAVRRTRQFARRPGVMVPP